MVLLNGTLFSKHLVQ